MSFDLTDLDLWYINLDSRPDRRAHAEKEFAKAGISARRLRGYLPHQWTGKSDKIKRMMARTKGAVGCWQSQTEAIKLGMASGKKLIGVFEDDVVLCGDFLKRISYILEHFPEDTDVFYLGATFHIPGQWCHKAECSTWGNVGKDAWPTDDPRIMRVPGQWGTYGYIVNANNGNRVLDALDAVMSCSDGIDHAFIRIGTALNTYCFVPGCAKQYDNESDIGRGKTIFSSFASLGPYWYSDKMDDFDPTHFDWQKGSL